MMTDPIGDMFTRIRNATRVVKPHVKVPFSLFKKNVAMILVSQGVVASCEEVKEQDMPHELVLALRYHQNGKSVVTDLQRVSRPGARIFVDHDHIAPMKQNFGFLIVSTPQGVMTGYEAKKRGVGGEVLGKVYIAG